MENNEIDYRSKQKNPYNGEDVMARTNEIKDWEKELKNALYNFGGSVVKNYEGLTVTPVSNMELLEKEILPFLTLLSEHRNKVLEEAKGVVKEREKTNLLGKWKEKNIEFTTRSLSGLLQIEHPIDTNKGYNFKYVTSNVEDYIIDLSNDLIVADRKDTIEAIDKLKNK